MVNIQSKSWVVQKYGGTSVGKFLDTITSSIVPGYLERHNVAIVCSARSGISKSKGTTNLLLDAIRLATSNASDTAAFGQVVDVIKEEHIQAAREAIPPGRDTEEILADLELAIRKDCEQLRAFLRASQTLGELSDRAQDKILAVGETLSCRIMTGSLLSKGISASTVILDDIVQEAYGQEHQQLSRAFKKNPSQFLSGLLGAIENRISNCRGMVPVITGFFGSMPDSLVHNVGRGYSDLCAAMCAATLNASCLEIWKEVDGIFTADPRKIKTARLLATVTSEEAAELTYYGSEVIHPLTMNQIDNTCIPLRLKNVMNPGGNGTLVFPSEISLTPTNRDGPGSLLDPQVGLSKKEIPSLKSSTFMYNNGYYGTTTSKYRRTPTALTYKPTTILNIRSNGTSSPQTLIGRVADIMQTHDITIDLVSSSLQTLSIAVNTTKEDSLENAVAELTEHGSVKVSKSMAIVSVIGHKMKNKIGVAAEIFTALAGARVNIDLISQGASEINISFVVKEEDAVLAMEVVHTNVMHIPLHSEQENHFMKGPWLY
ncbi:aspartate kinase [Dendryphion nanum]|uniref:Aspartokinase n=1 Tax=Dendryphion nanum TaxID=256645 RepID=A0A9P9CZH3_9PLEO|nr:aspartate kinase [Dendryphion nanum]